MTTRPKQLQLAVAAIMSGLGHLPAALIDKMAEAEQERVKVGGYTVGYARQASRNRVAMDKRAARKKRNRAKARRRYHG